MAISIDPTEGLTQQYPEDNLISLDVNTSEGLPVAPDVAQLRAFKTKFGVPAFPKAAEDIYSELVNGRENSLRSEIATTVDEKKTKAATRFVSISRDKLGRSPTAQEAQQLADKFNQMIIPSDPRSVVEEGFGHEWLHELYRVADRNPDSFLNDAKTEIPEELNNEIAKGSEIVAKREYALKHAQDLENVIKDQSWLGWGADQAKLLIPFYSDYKFRGNVNDVSKLAGGLLGSNLEEQGKALMRLPFNQFKDRLDYIVTNLQKDNPTAAVAFINAVVGMSTADVYLNNAFNVADISTLPLAKGAKALVSRIQEVAKAVKQVVKAAESPDVSKATVAEAAGDAAEAGIQKAVQNLTEDLTGRSNPQKRAMEALPTYLRVDVGDIKANPGRGGQETVNRLEEHYLTTENNLIQGIQDTIRVNRVPFIEASEDAVRKLRERIKDSYPGLGNQILDVSNPKLEPFTHTYHFDIEIGKPGEMQYFYYKQGAENFARNIGLTDFEVKQRGVGWYITTTKPLREVDDVVRDLIIETKNAKTPENWINGFFSWLRTPDETMSLDQRFNRKLATYGLSNLYKMLKPDYDMINALNKTEKNNLRRTVEVNRTMLDADGKPGYFFRSPGEFEDFYIRHFKDAPKEREVDAYFAYKRITEADRILRNISVWRNKSRVGAETHSFYVLDAQGNRVKSPEFDGVIRKEFPGGDDTILVLGKRQGEESLYFGGHVPTDTLNALRERVKNGELKVVELWSPEERPLAQFSDKVANARVRYIVSENVETKPLSWNQVPRRGGGHFDYEYNYYIKQAKMRSERIGETFKNWYEGDTTIMPVSIRSMGKDLAKKLDDVRKLIKEEKITEAKEYTKKNLPVEWDELRSWFKEGRDPEGKVIPPRLNLSEPIQVVEKNRMIADIDNTLERRYGATFRDGTKSGSLARQNQVAFTGERDAFEVQSVVDLGSRGNPLYKMEPARMVDPLTSINRALSRIVNSVYMDDYKTFSVEHWLREAAPYLKASESELRYSPYYYFYEAAGKAAWRANAPPEIVNQLRANHYKIRQFVGTPTTTDTLLQSFANKLADSIYTGLGPKALPLDPSWALPYLTDPFRFIRSVAFHAKIGLFNVASIWTQLQTHANIAGIAGPKLATSGTYASLLEQFGRINRNPAILDKLDELATKLRLPGNSNWKVGEFKEAFEALRKTGFNNVGGEYADLNTALSPKLIQNAMGRFLDAGTVFFKEGERQVRTASWYTAYREWRDANPVAQLGNKEIREILERADIFNANMSRASSSMLHSGILSVPTQFLTYQLRVMELFTGKRLTKIEKARLLGTYSVLYGLPVGLSAPGIPLADFIRSTAQDYGYVVGDNYISTLVMEGLPAVIGGIITGKGDMRKGTIYNVGDRWGPQGFETIREAMRGDESWWKVLGGASFSVLADAWEATDPFMRAMGSAIRDDGKSFPIALEDFADVFKEVSSVNNTWRAIVAYNTQRWMSKKGTYIGDISPLNAMFSALTGLQPQEFTDVNLKVLADKEQKEIDKWTLSKFIREFRRGLDTARDNNPEQSRKYFTRAFTYLAAMGYPENKIGSAIAAASKDNESLIDRIDWSYYVQDTPSSKINTRMEAYRRTLQLKSYREDK